MDTEVPPPPESRPASDDRYFPVRPWHLLRIRAVWAFPLVAAAAVVMLITAFYIGSVANPVRHLHGLPVAVVNEDHGVTVQGRPVNIGDEIEAGLRASPVLSDRLDLKPLSRSGAQAGMDRGRFYATVFIPAGLTADLTALAGTASGVAPAAGSRITILTNQRAGTVGVQLATGFLQPALARASHKVGTRLTAQATGPDPAERAMLANPISVATVQYRPLPPASALGLSAFYIALLILMTGFLSGTIINASIDSALGYATTDLGPRWRQRAPVPITRWRTLLVKWTIAAVLTGVVSGLMLLVAVGAIGLDAPRPGLLWLYAWLCSASVAAGTIVLFSVIGSYGQLVALLLFVYAGLASAGGTVPVEALPTPIRWISHAEPLRQILSGTRSLMYFDARGDAGLRRGLLTAAGGLAIWLIVGAVVVRWYDRRGLHRASPAPPDGS